MKNHSDVSGVPFRRIGGNRVPRLILGHLPFLGESYQGMAKNREFIKRFSDIGNTIRILRLAVEKFGVTVVAAGLAPETRLGTLFFQALKATEKVTGTKLGIIPCIQIPLTVAGEPVDVYRRWLTYYEVERPLVGERLLDKYLEDPVLQCRRDWKTKFRDALHHSNPYRERELRDLQIDYDAVDRAVTALQDFQVLFAELGSETDFLVLTENLGLLESLVDYVRRKLGACVLLGVHHAGTTIPPLEASRIEVDGYVTPVNTLGVMMFPTQTLALTAIKTANKPVVAIKPLAGGRIPPREALHYVYGEVGVDGCMVGVGSAREAQEDLAIACRILNEQRPLT